MALKSGVSAASPSAAVAGVFCSAEATVFGGRASGCGSEWAVRDVRKRPSAARERILFFCDFFIAFRALPKLIPFLKRDLFQGFFVHKRFHFSKALAKLSVCGFERHLGIDFEGAAKIGHRE